MVTEAGGCDVVAFYAWCMASITPAQALPLLARLGVGLQHEGRGLGAALLADVISRTAQIGSEVGCRGLLVHAESPAARAFYLHLIPEFEPSPTDPLHLVLLMKDILRTLR